MCKPLLLLACLFLSFYSFSQQNDFLSFRKKDRTIKSYFKGMPIAFVHINGSGVNGIIERVYNDTIYIKQFDVRMLPTPWGTSVQDTVGHYDLRFHYNEIAAIPRPPKAFEFVRNGTLFMIGGGGYAFLHTFNGLIQKETVYPSTLLISGGVAALGFTMHKLRKYYYPIGKKYSMVYVKMTSPTK
ncbi:hypothetical protein [Agriterribacter sp.]|uniref:hypothetical protein n=1 Tax=Agriterribacter sp. TaxID=2821509 RepID=UPI002BAC5B45|nr:hypothetical protein [Agriterribacter sp.]HTN05205.1 hypothetical protein [Agriterribacter sp.]